MEKQKLDRLKKERIQLRRRFIDCYNKLEGQFRAEVPQDVSESYDKLLDKADRLFVIDAQVRELMFSTENEEYIHEDQLKKIHKNEYLVNETKFQYLIQSTIENSPAHELVDSFSPSGPNYSNIIEQFTHKFGRRKELLVELYIIQLLRSSKSTERLNNEQDEQHYLPHRPVFKDTGTTKIWSVFDVSSADASVQSPEKVALGFITPQCVCRAPLKGFATPQCVVRVAVFCYCFI
ncbi:hypothetical protein J6590_044518 [Homalodisca vitripennis]|nr:hypothetical protein J6590_044518 [Homalodisca vitripennis]